MKKKQVVEAKFYKLKRDVAPLTYMLASQETLKDILYFGLMKKKGINRPT